MPKSYDYLVDAVTVFIGAFLGAFFAFSLKRHEDRQLEIKHQKTALNFALFVLIRQINAITGIRKDLESFKSPFERGFLLPAMKPPDYMDLRQNFSQIAFLIDKGDPNILIDLSLEQERFEQAMDSIRIRNEFYVNEVQPAISNNNLNGTTLTLGEYQKVLGERIFVGAINGAITMYDLVESSEKSLNTTYEKLREKAKDIFPNAKFIAWDKM